MQSTKFIHLRYGNLLDGRLEAKGGITIGFYLGDDKTVHYNVAKCANTDHYVKAIGRAITTGRLNKAIGTRQFKPVEDTPLVEQIIQHALKEEK